MKEGVISRVVDLMRRPSHSGGGKTIIITGTYGKTTTGSFLEAMLASSGDKVARLELTTRDDVKSWFTNFEIQAKLVNHVIIEVDPYVLSKGIFKGFKPAGVVVTSADTVDGILASRPGFVVMQSGQELQIADGLAHQVIHVGRDEASDARIEAVKLYRKGTELSVSIDHQVRLSIATQLVGTIAADNLATALATYYLIGGQVDQVHDAVADIEPLPGVLEGLTQRGGATVYVDGGQSVVAADRAIDDTLTLARRRVLVGVSRQSQQQGIDLAAIKTKVDRLVVTTGDVPVDDLEQGKDDADTKSRVLRASREGDVVVLLGREFIETAVDRQEGV